MIHLFSFLCPHPPISCYRWLALHKSASAGDLFLLNGSSSIPLSPTAVQSGLIDWSDHLTWKQLLWIIATKTKLNWKVFKSYDQKNSTLSASLKKIVWNTVYLPSECATKRASIVLHVREQLFHGFIIRARNTRQLWRGSTCWTSQCKWVQRVYSRLFSSS